MIAIELIRGPLDGTTHVFRDDQSPVIQFAQMEPPRKMEEGDGEIMVRMKTISYIRERRPLGRVQGLPRYRAFYVPEPS